ASVMLTVVIGVFVSNAAPLNGSMKSAAAMGPSSTSGLPNVGTQRTTATPRFSPVPAGTGTLPATDGYSDTTFASAPAQTTTASAATTNGLSYETYIPRPTRKGYYVPKVV